MLAFIVIKRVNEYGWMYKKGLKMEEKIISIEAIYFNPGGKFFIRRVFPFIRYSKMLEFPYCC